MSLSIALMADDTFWKDVEASFHHVELLVVDWTDVWVNKTSEMSWNDATMRPMPDRPVDQNRVDGPPGGH